MAEVLIRDVPEAVLAVSMLMPPDSGCPGWSTSVGVWRLMRLVRERWCLLTTCVPSPTDSPIRPTSRSWGGLAVTPVAGRQVRTGAPCRHS